MRIYGIDFTSAPSKKKPITVAVCTYDEDQLCVEGLDTLPHFGDFEAFLATDGPWVTGMDFAFGQPRKFVDNMGFPTDWEAFVDLIEQMGKKEWVRTVDKYMQPREKGDKLHFRPIDRLTGAQSPMKMYFIPVGRMFYEGARRLAAADVSVIPNRPRPSSRVALEVYPALIVRKLMGRGSKYKSDDTRAQTDTAAAKRSFIIRQLPRLCETDYGFSLQIAPGLTSALVDDPTGDQLDAVLAAVQAAWGYTRRHENYGVPEDVDPIEGWIVDPETLEATDG